MKTDSRKPIANSQKRKRKRSKGGRPTDYRARYADDVREFLLYYENATDEDIAKYFDKSVSTINLWKVKYPKFSEAIHSGKMRFRVQVGSALFKAALGQEIIEEKMTADGEVVQLKKFIPGDVAAMKFILTNSGGKQWRDKHDHTIGNPDGTAFVPQATIEGAAMVAELLYQKTVEQKETKETEKGKV